MSTPTDVPEIVKLATTAFIERYGEALAQLGEYKRGPMSTPTEWTDHAAATLRREQRHPCDCSECSCEVTVRGGECCGACEAGTHRADDLPVHSERPFMLDEEYL